MLKYKDVTFEYIIQKEQSDHICVNRLPTLVLVYSGELLVKEGICEVCIKRGEFVFIEGDINIPIIIQCVGEEIFQGIFWEFGRIFLKDFYLTLDKNKIPVNYQCFTGNIVKLSSTVYLRSLYVSLIPYIRMNVKLPVGLLDIKSQEAVHCLMSADIILYTCLFEDVYTPTQLFN